MTALLTPAASLFSRARGGDSEALDLLLREHADAITAVCRRRLRSRVDADDAVQETMVRAMGALDGVRDEQRLKSYLCRIAERVCLDMMRAGARPMPAPDEQHVDCPETMTIRKEEAELVRRTLLALSERQAQALWMRDAMGEPVPTVAAELGVTEGSARVILTRARKQMREGWAKAAAMLPGFGLKLPAPVAKLLATTGLVPTLAAPAAVLIAAALVIPGWGDAQPTADGVDLLPSLIQDSGLTVGSIPTLSSDGASTPALSATATPTIRTTSDTTAGPGIPAEGQRTETRVPTVGGGEVVIDRDDPHDDDVTAGDDDLIGVGTSLGETLQEVGVGPAAAEPDDELLGP